MPTTHRMNSADIPYDADIRRFVGTLHALHRTGWFSKPESFCTSYVPDQIEVVNHRTGEVARYTYRDGGWTHSMKGNVVAWYYVPAADCTNAARTAGLTILDTARLNEISGLN